ncbi:GNAT family N-acetyltransferase [[Haemophilus] felis]|uniref:GNAT family N-acetyltransferase n=1 Tax=[Haemophilus] felis TaxID=123822 RepID=A0A1T0B8A5_9PAST|nr:GNAT family N-acetyltransferase [[Haemophilus] felis]NBI40805.1 GNAT family N-acetyltransferase [[Haemophilus] felis]NBI43754.1 GNAT family N-acetyltransferase [[Haemophilus] felis]OOS06159.1 GNAT family N-acetyltransferase [[Haemophilus] felis]
MKIFKAEQWNLEILLPLFEQYRLAQGMSENPDRTLAFLANRIRFNESIFFIAVHQQQAVGFIQLYPRISSLQLQRYWQLNDIFVVPQHNHAEICHQLIAKAKEFVFYTRSNRLVAEPYLQQQGIFEQAGFKHNATKTLFELSLTRL